MLLNFQVRVQGGRLFLGLCCAFGCRRLATRPRTISQEQNKNWGEGWMVDFTA